MKCEKLSSGSKDCKTAVDQNRIDQQVVLAEMLTEQA